jgi:hypothetical protein
MSNNKWIIIILIIGTIILSGCDVPCQEFCENQSTSLRTVTKDDDNYYCRCEKIIMVER